ncbi:hypothetical protein VZQ01_06160 [Myxococcus faecalis]|uniref:hypothetical protein n=1 Tax=Myxococcus TaxID=32 RepID=UPI001CBAED43|nr:MULTISPECIES: hypothetical protein [unclassified Myxococcus]MBZ4401184.1 hypothetical protein [Myxococcus sp. AS-1-15]MBZ4410993.1 hypothetical protein [Myxococcus sp. XM-1-1-1]
MLPRLLVLRFALALGLALVSSGCATSSRGLARQRAEPDYCVPAQSPRDDSAGRLDVEAPLPESPELQARFTRQDLLLAHAAGVLVPLETLARLAPGTDTRAQRDALLRDIELRLLLFSTTLSSVSAELECEARRTAQMARLLDAKETRRQTLLTVSSIVVGALTTTVTAISNNDRANDIIDITGGAVGAGLGLAALFSSPSLDFEHPRNLLADIWRQPARSADFPASLWFVLSHKDFSNAQRHAIRHNVRARWIASGYVEETGGDAPYFGRGGRYTLDALQTRANMLGELQAAVRLIHQNLQVLLTKLVTVSGQGD